MNAFHQGRDNVSLTVAEASAFDRLVDVFEVIEEHLLDPELLTQVYSS